MIDVRIGMAPQPFGHEIHEGFERLLLLAPVVGPERHEAFGAVVDDIQAEQVLEAAVRPRGPSSCAASSS
ncbi:Uncharacterised protein [Bordetella pertussis]|nr:Uncharacterised protein [Bordetella pertussis]